MLAGRLILLSLTLATAARVPTRVAGAPDWPRPEPSSVPLSEVVDV